MGSRTADGTRGAIVPEITASIDVGVWCSGCGAGLCRQSSTVNGHDVTVEPCEKCLDVARGEGYEEGYEAAIKEKDY